MKTDSRKLCIVGAGGFGREVLSSFKDSFIAAGIQIEKEIVFMDDHEKYKGAKVLGVDVIRTSDFVPSAYDVVIAVGDPFTRKRIAENLPETTSFKTLIHPTAIVMEDCEIGEGSIITAQSIVTCNISIGKHSQLNLHTTVGHDCTIGDYFTTAPGTHISGECRIGDCVYFGTNASIRQGVSVCDEVTIGMGGVVVKHISEKGVYIGNPLKKLDK